MELVAVQLYSSPATRLAYGSNESIAENHVFNAGRPSRISMSVVNGSWYLHRSSVGIISASTAVKSLPRRNNPPSPVCCASKAALSLSSSAINLLRRSNLSSSVNVSFLPAYTNPKPAAPKSSFICTAALYSGVSNSICGVSGNSSSRAASISEDSHTMRRSFLPSSPWNNTAGTNVEGTNALYHSGLFCNEMSCSSYGMPFARRTSQIRSQKGHQPLVSR
mmetsp:Transcript_29417/g.62455  ORF Transcript_29417/g.62455 Transcript_29417/m.62455 type:complete len:221 (-) Transcript_29417:329-991(-)